MKINIEINGVKTKVEACLEVLEGEAWLVREEDWQEPEQLEFNFENN